MLFIEVWIHIHVLDRCIVPHVDDLICIFLCFVVVHEFGETVRLFIRCDPPLVQWLDVVRDNKFARMVFHKVANRIIVREEDQPMLFIGARAQQKLI